MSTPANANTSNFTAPPSVASQIARLPELPMPEIKALWQRLFGDDTPTHNRQFLERRIAYRLQEASGRIALLLELPPKAREAQRQRRLVWLSSSYLQSSSKARTWMI